MRRAWLLAGLLAAAPAQASLSPAQLEQASAAPPAGARLPAELSFTDAQGRRLRLGDAAGGLPVVLLFVDYTCGHVCGPGLTLTAGALADAELRPGRDLALVTIGIDAKDTPADALAMARARLATLPEAARAIRLLDGDAATIAAAERALGYHAVYDPASDQFAHDAAVYVFARDGRLAALLPEIGQQPAAFRAALAGADRPQAPTLFEHAASLCYGLAAAHGRYSEAIVVAVRAGALLVLVALALVVWRRRDARA